MEADRKIELIVLGATGSIGDSTLSLVRDYPALFRVVGLCAHQQLTKLRSLVAEFRPQIVGVTGAIPEPGWLSGIEDVPEVVVGAEAASDVACFGSSQVTVVAGIVGMAGMRSVHAALGQGRRVVLANKESLVCAGSLMLEQAVRGGGTLIPADSEHSALHQLLLGSQRQQDIRRLLLTASGGPFLDTPLEKLNAMTPAEAVRHPRWSMGAKISVDSATLVNKGLEVLEAHWLFGGIDISAIIHPESIIHSLVEFVDGVLYAHMSVPDMRGPLSFAIGYPGPRLPSALSPLDFTENSSLTFRPLEPVRHRAIFLAQECIRVGGVAGAVYSIANEWCVQHFLSGSLSFVEIVPHIERCLEIFHGRGYGSLADLEHLKEDVHAYLRGGL